MTLAIKPGVTFTPTLALAKMLTTLLTAGLHTDWARMDDVVITSGTDGTHTKASQHYKGTAIDLRAKDMPEELREQFRKGYEQALGPKFRVLHESIGTPNEHFHVQVKRGATYGPEDV